MQIDRADLRFAKQIVLHLHRPGVGRSLRIATADRQPYSVSIPTIRSIAPLDNKLAP